MDKLSHFDFSFQKKLDKIVEANWHKCFEKNYGFGSPQEHFFDHNYGILGSDPKWVGLGGHSAHHSKAIPKGVPPYTPRIINDDMPSKLGINFLHNTNKTLLPIIFYISENWHNTLALIDKKVSEVVTLIGKKTDENRDKITSLQIIIDKQTILLESLETRLAEQQKCMEKIMESRGTIDKYIGLHDVSNDPWCNIDDL